LSQFTQAFIHDVGPITGQSFKSLGFSSVKVKLRSHDPAEVSATPSNLRDGNWGTPIRKNSAGRHVRPRPTLTLKTRCQFAPGTRPFSDYFPPGTLLPRLSQTRLPTVCQRATTFFGPPLAFLMRLRIITPVAKSMAPFRQGMEKKLAWQTPHRRGIEDATRPSDLIKAHAGMIQWGRGAPHEVGTRSDFDRRECST
jgi:hypothetical protein